MKGKPLPYQPLDTKEDTGKFIKNACTVICQKASLRPKRHWTVKPVALAAWSYVGMKTSGN